MQLKKKLLIISCFLLALMLISLGGIMKTGAECTANPLVYGAKVADEAGGGGMLCTCYFNDYNYNPLHFTKDGVVNGLPLDTMPTLSP